MTRHTGDLTTRPARAATASRQTQLPIRMLPLITGSTAAALITGCATTPDAATPASATPHSAPTTPHTVAAETSPPTTPSPTASSVPMSSAPGDGPATTVADATTLRFAAGDIAVDVTIAADNATTRDFVSLLPLTMTFEDFNEREKIGDLPRELDTAGSPGHDPENGDLIYFTPWGNLGFYYNTDGIDFSSQVIHLGTFDTTPDQLESLEAGNVNIDVAG